MEEIRDNCAEESSVTTYNIRHRCFYFSKDIVLWVKELKYDTVFRSMIDQLVRSATSIGANIVEGRSGSSRND